MRRLFALLTVASMLTFSTYTVAQDGEDSTMMQEETTKVDSGATDMDSSAAAEPVMEEEAPVEAAAQLEEEPAQERGFHQYVKDKFIQGGPGFMSLVMLALIIGMALVIERVLYLSMATTNTKKLLDEVEGALKSGGVNAAKEVCRNTAGPVASIFYQGLDRAGEGVDMVEKSVISYGSVQVGNMERNLSWISLFIALAPMLGFFGTVVGMIDAFDAIAAANNISPGIVAGGIGVALITTLAGLLVAMILQLFYNYIVSKVDSLTNEMEDASISLVDLVVKHMESNK